jgi:hypothetical protein
LRHAGVKRWRDPAAIKQPPPGCKQ